MIRRPGCAHPGIVEIVSQARRLGSIHLVMGGFHLKDANEAEIGRVIDGLKRLGVRKVAPSHCTGALAMRLFEAAFGSDFIPAGAGAQIRLKLSGLPTERTTLPSASL
jgi:7,8-dihydropterin-6-yl-methyl-4-(beta-D-ribofuranosyl)aminobenzene 5'-phosphate synthase